MTTSSCAPPGLRLASVRRTQVRLLHRPFSNLLVITNSFPSRLNKRQTDVIPLLVLRTVLVPKPPRTHTHLTSPHPTPFLRPISQSPSSYFSFSSFFPSCHLSPPVPSNPRLLTFNPPSPFLFLPLSPLFFCFSSATLSCIASLSQALGMLKSLKSPF